MQFSKSIIELIRERTSWRTYLDKILDETTRKKIETVIKDGDFNSPFKNVARQSRFRLISIPDFDPNENVKVGTYGMIKGAQEFIAGATEKSEYDLENYGYLFETIILVATDLDLGTCWLGGTFNRSQFANFLQLNENEVIPAITPIGYPATRRWKEKVIRSVIKAKVRKPWDEIFFTGDFNTPIDQKQIGEYKMMLDMVRIGPSAGNNQPWRIVKERERMVYHFFVKHSEDKKLSAYNQFVRLDIGIAICHFDLSAKELGISGEWKFTKPDVNSPKELKYIISWIGRE